MLVQTNTRHYLQIFLLHLTPSLTKLSALTSFLQGRIYIPATYVCLQSIRKKRKKNRYGLRIRFEYKRFYATYIILISNIEVKLLIHKGYRTIRRISLTPLFAWDFASSNRKEKSSWFFFCFSIFFLTF